ncbi:unnamed protein product [Euphydryas editha]|uniref:YqaJ viral recombinase domain-containing protein n=1 Tax=Euphydryas editha TaxID=104508 RepID=A0AAU9VCK2_EUPED|nr:unnamed protein product [Euphydryas editha]
MVNHVNILLVINWRTFYRNPSQECGLFIDPELPFLGASPDGLVGEKIVEIKCPYSAKGMSVDDEIIDSRLDRQMKIKEPDYILNAIKERKIVKKRKATKEQVQITKRNKK